MKKRQVILLIGVLLLMASVTVPLMAEGGGEKTTELPRIKYAMCDPMSGPCATTGMSRHFGAQILCDLINDQGGIVVGGKHYLIEHLMYDNVSWNPFDEKKAYEKMILKDKVRFSISTWTSATTKAVAEICQENKHLRLSWGAGWLHPDYPFIMSTETGGPLYWLGEIETFAKRHPESKRIAMLLSDNAPNLSAKPWIYLAAKVLGFQVVYDKIHPDATVDYMPVLSAVLASKPDVILLGCATDWQGPAVEAAMTLGYKGKWMSESLYPQVHTKEAWAWLSSLDTYSCYGNYQVKTNLVPDICYEVYKLYEDRYPGQWVSNISEAINSTLFWKYAVETTNSLDPAVVMEKLYAMPEVIHPVFGKSKWGGKDIFGANHWLITPVGINKLINGKETIVAMPSIADFLDKYKAEMLEMLEKENLKYKP